MLAARSAVFKAQLFGSMNLGLLSSSVAKIENIKANVFQGLLTFIYTDGMPKFKSDDDDETEDKEEDDDTGEDETEEDGLLQLLEAAERYGKDDKDMGDRGNEGKGMDDKDNDFVAMDPKEMNGTCTDDNDEDACKDDIDMDDVHLQGTGIDNKGMADSDMNEYMEYLEIVNKTFRTEPELRVPKHIRQRQSQPVYLDLDEYFEFVKREVFERSRHLKDDSFVIRCDLVVLESAANKEKGTTLLPFTELPQSDLQSHLGDLLLSKEGADVTFEVDGKQFAAHRYMLAARSAVFKAQLFGSMNAGAATSSVAKIENIKANVFQGLLTFIYTDGMPKFKSDDDDETEDKEEDDDTEEDETEEDWLLQLLEAAERYGIQRLKSICEEKLTELICKDTVADIIVVAERNGCLWLKQSCLEFVKTSTNLLTVFTADGLEQIIRTCSPSVLKELLSKFAS
ncbi:hypothetical protein ZWY2020_016157 [Hordeum vulgare]|nr:hypothetical protein ZWY2020_016157 [Hordeum vulgare]